MADLRESTVYCVAVLGITCLTTADQPIVGREFALKATTVSAFASPSSQGSRLPMSRTNSPRCSPNRSRGSPVTRSRSIAVAQTCPVAGDVKANLDEHFRLARLAATEGAQIVVFPELSLTGYELG